MKNTYEHGISDKNFDQLSEFAKIQRPQWGWVREIRRILGMTMCELAEKMDVSVARIAMIEKDETSLNLSTMQKVADALDLNFVYALVPKTSLKEIKRNQVKEKAEIILKEINKDMSAQERRVLNKALLNAITEDLLLAKKEKLRSKKK